jgi:epsilon-lactone hydrolase
VLPVGYRLAPEPPCPAAVDDALFAYLGLLATGVLRARIAFVGESGAGCLAVAARVAARVAGRSQPSAAVLFSLWVDPTEHGGKRRRRCHAHAGRAPAAGQRLRRRGRPSTGALSPPFADLRRIAPLLIQAGTHEVLLDDATRIAATAAAVDVAVQRDVTPGVPHVFQAFRVLDEGQAAIARAGTFLRACVEPAL